MTRVATSSAVVGLLLLCLAEAPAAATVSTSQPSQGTLYIASEKGIQPGKAFPLTHTGVSAHVTGFVAQVRVQQTFNNPFAEPLEAIYVFPLPENAAVGAMTITIGGRVITGVIKSREEARRIYERAKRAGKTTALLDQERANIFTQSVANIPAHTDVIVDIVYDVRLRYHDDHYEFVYPMVVGPRYIPGTPDGKPSAGGRAPNTDEVADASRITPPTRKPGSRSGHDITMEVTIDPGLEIHTLRSPTHKVTLARDYAVSQTAVRVTIPAEDRIPNKDFVLRYQLAGDKPQMTVLAEKAAGTGYFALMFEPPAQPAPADISAKEVFFVIDSSSSMSGEPMGLIKKAMRYALRNLGPSDSFQIIRFSSATSALSPTPLTSSPANVRRGLSYINGFVADGGTEMLQGVRAALAGKDAKRLRIVCFMTDGYIGNDRAIVAEVERLIDEDTRLFAFGVGSSPNRALLERLAEVGRGAAHYMLLSEPPADQVASFYARIRAPVLTHIEVDWQGLAVTDLSPAPIPDLFAGQPLAIIGRYKSSGEANIKVRGRIGKRKVEYVVPVALPAAAESAGDSHADSRTTTTEAAPTRSRLRRDSLARLWARARIRGLMASQYAGDRPQARAAIIKLALAHRLVTKYTSFVAVEDKVVKSNGKYRTYQVPVEMPEGVAFDAVFRQDEGEYHDDDDLEVREHAMATKAAPEPTAGAAYAESISLDARLATPGSWRWGVSASLGHGAFGDTDGAVTGLSMRADKMLSPRLALGAQFALLLPLTDSDDAFLANLLVELVYRNLAGGIVDLVIGSGGAIPSSSGFGLAYMAALELKVPWRIAPGFQLRLDGAALPDKDDIYGITLGLKVQW